MVVTIFLLLLFLYFFLVNPFLEDPSYGHWSCPASNLTFDPYLTHLGTHFSQRKPLHFCPNRFPFLFPFLFDAWYIFPVMFYGFRATVFVHKVTNLHTQWTSITCLLPIQCSHFSMLWKSAVQFFLWAKTLLYMVTFLRPKDVRWINI